MKKRFLLGLINFLIIPTVFAQTVTNVGTDFWIAFPPNWQLSSTLKLYISSNYSTSGTVFSAFPGVNQDFTVSPGVVTQLNLPPLVVLQAGVEEKGIHVTSNDPISLYGLNWMTMTADAFLALPVNALGSDYRIISYFSDLSGRGSGFGVVATENGTVLTVFNHQTNTTSTVNLEQGQTYYVEGPIPGQDLTGSRVQSNFPVAVFGSVEITNIPQGCAAGDHIVEQMFPCYSWGKNFVTVSLAGRDGSGDIFRILAAEDLTDITINGIPGPTINAGSYYEVNLAGNNSITTSKPAMVAQYAKGMMCSGATIGDPLMMLIPPREQFLTNYTFCTAFGFAEHWVNVVVPDYALNYIYQDGIPIPISSFTPISTTNFYGAQISVEERSHTFTSPFPFGLFVYGWNEFNSYGYPAGTSMSPVSSISNVSISPATATGVLNVSTLCFTAHVTDNLSNPVAGVLVNFYISGMSNITGTGYTDASGNAQYCYARTGTVPGTDNIYAEIFGFTSTTSTATWTIPCANPTSAEALASARQVAAVMCPLP